MYDLDYYETALMLDPNYNGSGSNDFLEDYLNSQQEPQNLPQWQLDAVEDLFETIQEDPRIDNLLDAYEQIPQPAEHVTNMVTNQTAQWVTENAQAGAYDEFINQFTEMNEHATAWESANGFADPFLDWDTFGDTSWTYDGPTWWGDEYGIY